MNRQLSIILASASPRRKQLLAEAGYKFRVVPSGIDESAFPTVNVMPIEYAKRLALAKAKDVAARFPNVLVIGADTIADSHGQIVGKPEDAKDAERIIRRLFSRPHKVITGLALVRLADNLQIVKADTTVVYPKPLTDAQVATHLASGAWRNKAGAYAIKETDDPLVDRIKGSLSNVMGLPMQLLEQLLAGIGPAGAV